MKDKLRYVKTSEIVVGERFREDMGNIEELKASIQEKGILQPITLNQKLELLAGHRRYTAASAVGLKEIPVLIREVEGEIDEREIELIENVHRKDFTWQEQAKLRARIHALKKEQDPMWSGEDTAKLLDTDRMSVSRANRLAAALEVMPELGECKTADDAMKLLKKAEENAIVQELARRQQTLIKDDHTAMSPKQKGLAATLKVADANYVVQDVFTYMKGLRTSGHIDLIECDPPYGIDLPKVSDRGDKGVAVAQRDNNYNEIPREQYADFLAQLTKELYRVAGTNCWMLFWFAFEWEAEAKLLLRAAGWHVDDVPALWHKGLGRTPRPDILLARAYEPFLVCRKGQPTLIKQGRLNVWVRNPDEKKYHPAQRPVGLICDLLGTFIDGAAQVFVPFAGSGATLRACYKQGFRVIGVDNNEEYKPHFMLAVEEDTKKLLSSE